MKRLPPLFLIPALVAFLKILLSPFGFDDYFYYLKSGEYFWRTGHVLATNLFSFTSPDFPWINHAWGSGVVFFGVHQLFGNYAVHVLNAFGFLGAAWVFHRSLSRRTQSPNVIFLLNLGFAVLLGLPYSAVRPWLFSNFLFVIEVGLLSLVLTRWQEEGIKHFASVFWLFPILLLWVNLHGSYPVGVALALLIWAFLASKPWHFAVPLVLLALPIVSPNGIENLWVPFQFVFEFANHHGSPIANLSEWQPIYLFKNPSDGISCAVVVLISLCIASGFRDSMRQDRKVIWVKYGYFVLSVLLICQASRNFYYFYVGNALLFPQELERLLGKGRQISTWPDKPCHWGLIPLLAVLSFGFSKLRPLPDFDPEYWPPSLIAQLERNGSVFGDRVLWDFQFSSLPIYRSDLNKKVFFDSREYCYPRSVYSAFDRLDTMDLKGAVEFSRVWKISSYVIKRGSALDRVSLRWRKEAALEKLATVDTIYEDEFSRVIVIKNHDSD